MNEQKYDSNNRPGQSQQNQQRSNNTNQNNQQKRDQFPRVDAQKVASSSEPVGQKYVSIAIIAFLLGFGAAALWFGDSTGGNTGTNATSTNATSTRPSTVNTSTTTTTSPVVTETIPSVSQNQPTTQITPSVPTQNLQGSVVVDNQEAGMSVFVNRVTLSEPVWLAVTEPVAGGVRILGAALVDVGVHDNVEIELLRTTLFGKEYSVVARSYVGSSVFDPAINKPVTNSNGQLIADTFIAQ